MGFFACYLLTPVALPQRLRCTYVGFTVSPTRRIRQHNGELVNGAKRTTKYRPWEMIVVVHGFPSKFHALQFEYAWQHPYTCRFTKERIKPLKGTKGLGHPRSVKRKLIELHEMLHVAPWVAFPLTVTYTNLTIQNLVRTSSYFEWPAHMTCEVRPLHEFASCQVVATAHSQETEDDDHEPQRKRSTDGVCCICDATLSSSGLQVLRCYHSDCGAEYHALCLADHFLLELSMFADDDEASGSGPPQLRPEQGTCPDCSGELLWPLLVKRATSKPSPTTQRAVRGAPKKRRRDEAKSRRSDKIGRPSRGGFDNLTGGDDSHVSKAANAEHRESLSADSDGYEDAGWFDDDISATEYLDHDDEADGHECDGGFPSQRPLAACNSAPISPVPSLVDLTLVDD